MRLNSSNTEALSAHWVICNRAFRKFLSDVTHPSPSKKPAQYNNSSNEGSAQGLLLRWAGMGSA
eukprot:CAMPEP_0117456778 /NCGR_PEP_ID=MMETSP0784-20121206/20_1 /TAXON_ID=39447 /ORGANISM="" /LENGTH=63 /DNA_ID=CAMNT_0005250135 /DNA_START=790 /DNA_END=981 /DNA_ORIENTATION=+